MYISMNKDEWVVVKLRWLGSEAVVTLFYEKDKKRLSGSSAIPDAGFMDYDRMSWW